MPELTFTVRWPDGDVTDCWSPSLVVHDHLASGTTYTVADFRARAAAALHEASERVRAAYGFACTASAASLERIEARAARHDPDERLEVLRLHPPLPPTT